MWKVVASALLAIVAAANLGWAKGIMPAAKFTAPRAGTEAALTAWTPVSGSTDTGVISLMKGKKHRRHR
jgi:hypothetical protein